MFKQLTNINSAFSYIRTVSLLVIAGSVLISVYATYKSYRHIQDRQQVLYVLVNGKALEAYASSRKENMVVEAKDHIKVFHQYFFNLSPDDQAILASITQALYRSDASAKKQYDDLKEANYYSNIISANISQTLRIDSVQLDMNVLPIRFRCYGQQTLTRPSSVLTRSLITSGQLREVSRSENNPHGFLIERWRILENRDLRIQQR